MVLATLSVWRFNWKNVIVASVVLISSKAEFLVVLGSVQKPKGRISGSLPQIKAGTVRSTPIQIFSRIISSFEKIS